MKTTLILAALALTGCSAFTAPKDPVTGIFDLAS
jgi:PBP1b-binding outer membrane lipoprotein LpoB